MPTIRRNKEKLIIYQVFPRIFTNTNATCVPNGTLAQNGCGKMNHFTDCVLKSIKQLGVNAIWYTGIIEMATKTEFKDDNIPADNYHIVKGEAGSPYAIKDYYDVNPAIAENVSQRMNEFEALVKRTHKNGLKCFIDFVPNHTARRYHSDMKPDGVVDFGVNDDTTKGFSPTNDYYYITAQQFAPSIDINSQPNPYIEFPAKATGNDCFTAFCSQYDWYETVKLNYGKDYGNGQEHFSPIPSVWFKMLQILRFWASKGVDGFRCDMVFMVPLPFWNWVIPMVKKDYPNIIFIGEIYDVGQYRPYLDYGHFDYLYDKVNLYDTLVGIERHNVSAARLTGCWQAVDGIGEKMVNFLENHDEVRYGSVEFANDPSTVIPHLVVSSMINRGPFILYYGQELGERATENEGFAGYNNRTTIFDYWSYSSMRRWYDNGKCDGKDMTPQERWLRNTYSRILTICNQYKAISEGDFFDLMYVNLNNPDFNPHRHYVFLRYDKDDVMLIAANFDQEKSRIKVNIPTVAFEMSGLPEKSVKAVNLLDDAEVELKLSSSAPVELSIKGRNALILKITKSHKTQKQIKKAK